MKKSNPSKVRPAAGGPESISATAAQNNFGRVLDRVSSEGVVYITKHQRPHAVVLSVDRYQALTRNERPDLDALTREYDRMMERMQTPEAAEAYDALFAASSDSLGAAAVRGVGQGAVSPRGSKSLGRGGKKPPRKAAVRTKRA